MKPHEYAFALFRYFKRKNLPKLRQTLYLFSVPNNSIKYHALWGGTKVFIIYTFT